MKCLLMPQRRSWSISLVSNAELLYAPRLTSTHIWNEQICLWGIILGLLAPISNLRLSLLIFCNMHQLPVHQFSHCSGVPIYQMYWQSFDSGQIPSTWLWIYIISEGLTLTFSTPLESLFNKTLKTTMWFPLRLNVKFQLFSCSGIFWCFK